jgi:predicted nucleotidyltransferase
MIIESDKNIIREISKKYNASRVILFGSSLDPARESSDIDIAVEGIAQGDFFKFYGDLLMKLSKPVDVLDLSVRSKFIDMIEREGVSIFD